MSLRITTIGPSFADYQFTHQQLERLQGAIPPGGELEVFNDPETFRASLHRFDVAAGQLGHGTAPAFGRLRWLHSWSAGMDGEPIAACAAAGVTVTCSKGNGAIPIAEYTILAMLMLARSAVRWIEAQTAHAWRRHVSQELHGRTVGLIGLGHIGTEIAVRAQGLGMTCLAYRRRPEQGSNVDGVEITASLSDLLGRADFVVVTVPLTPATAGMLGAAEFAAMRPDAYFICVSRGAVVNQTSLIEALKAGRIAGAALDAHAEEPLPADSPLWDLPNTIVTPHNAGTTIGSGDRAVQIFIENLERFHDGRELTNVVDPDHGY